MPASELARPAFVQSGMGATDRRRFGDYEIDLETGELRRNGQAVPLQRQPARVLVRLVARPGTLVPRQELQATVWGDGVHVDFDRGLNYCIRQLRQTLGDDPKAPRFIETVARQGYRFVAAVHPVEVGPDGVHGLPRPRGRWRLGLAAAGVVVIGMAVDRLSGGSPQHHEIAVAVVRAVHDAVF